MRARALCWLTMVGLGGCLEVPAPAAGAGGDAAPGDGTGIAVDAQSITEIPIVASIDDAEERPVGGAVILDGVRLDLGVDVDTGTLQLVGLRFRDIPVAAGGLVVAASIQFTSAPEAGDGDATFEISAELSIDAAPFEATDGNLSTRSRSSTPVVWVPDNWQDGQATPSKRSPDLSGLIEEVVALPGWESGNSLVFIIEGAGSRVAYSLDGLAAAAPILLLE